MPISVKDLPESQRPTPPVYHAWTGPSIVLDGITIPVLGTIDSRTGEIRFSVSGNKYLETIHGPRNARVLRSDARE